MCQLDNQAILGWKWLKAVINGISVGSGYVLTLLFREATPQNRTAQKQLHFIIKIINYD
jgi:hypothetical protein